MSGLLGRVINLDDGYIGTLSVGAILLTPSDSNPIPGDSSGIYLNSGGTLSVSDPSAGSSTIIIENTLNLTLDSYVDIQTYQENKNAQEEINDTILASLDGYSSSITESEHYLQLSQAVQDIVSVIDGYSTDVELLGLVNTVTENNNQQQQINQSIIQALDGYSGGSNVSETTFQENKNAQNEINHQILVALDGYATSASSGVSDQTFQENKTAQEEINDSILATLDGYASAQGTSTQIAYFSGANALASDINLSFDVSNNRLVAYSVQMTGGAPSDGYVLTSDASGVATWQRPPIAFPSDRVFTVDATHPQADFTTIQDAITHASDGYMIIVSPGSYNEQLTLRAGISIEIVGSSNNAAAYVDVNWRFSTDGYVITAPDAGAGTTVFKNMRFSLVYDGFNNSTAILRMPGPSYGITCEDCTFSAITQGPTGGRMMGALVYGGTLILENCELSADDNDGIFDVDTMRIGGGSVTLKNTTTYGFNTADIRIDGGQASLTLENSTVVGTMVVGNVQNIFLDRVSRIGSIVGNVSDNDTEIKLTSRVYGVALTNGQNDLYKLNLREIGQVDVGSPNDGDIWYSRAAGRFRKKEGGFVSDLIPYSTLDGYGGGGVSETTFQENKNAQNEINHQVITALDAYGAASADTILLVTGDQSISSSGFVDITNLTFSVDASSNYLVEAFVIFQSSATTMGVRFAVNGPASPTLTYIMSKKMVTTPGTASTDMFSEAALTAYDTPLPASTSEPANNTNLLWEAKGIFMNGSNAGTFALRFDKENVAGTATIKAGSFLKYKKL